VNIVFSLESTKFSGDTDARSTQDMTARPPVDSREASSEGSSEPLETGDSQTSHDTALNGEGDGSKVPESGMLGGAEPSMSRTLEAILSKSDADDDLSVPPQDEGEGGGERGEGADSIGTRTLLGIGASGLPLPPRAAKPDGKTERSSDDEQIFSVEDLFDDEGTAVSSIRANGKSATGNGRDDQMSDLLDEVAEALNTQAASHDSTVGALPGKPVPRARPIRTDQPSARRSGDEFEFEDPDDGPTTLNVHGEHSEDVDVGADDDDEAVVLGPARLPPSRPLPALSGRLPSPAAYAGDSATSGATKTATPFAGLAAATLPSFPAPASGRSRLPTPAPGQAIGGPPPGRVGLPGGTPVNGVPSSSSQGDSSRRSASGRTAATGTDRSVGHHATAAVIESLSSAMESASVVLKKDVKFRVASLGGVVVATFVVGLLIGRAVVGSGNKTTAQASEKTPTTTEQPVAAAAPAKPPVEVPAATPPVAAPVAPAQNRPEAIPAAPPPPAVAELAPAPAPLLGDAPPPAVHKRRVRRTNLALKDDGLPIPSAPRPAVAPPKAKPGAATPAGKRKSTWHDPFAD